MLIAGHFSGGERTILGISEAIARVKREVRSGGVSGAFLGLSAELRSDTIPAALRPAATKLADLLRVPQAAELAHVPVALETVSAAHTHVEQVGVAPFSGMSASMGGLRDSAPEMRDEATGVAHAQPSPVVDVSLEQEAELMFTALSQSQPPVQVELALEMTRAVVPDLSSKAESALVHQEGTSEGPRAQIPVKGKRTRAEGRAKKAPTSEKPVAVEVAGSEKVAASTPANETSARPSAKPPVKRPSAKAGRKKD